MPLVEQELLTLRSTWFHPQFLVRFVLLNLYFLVNLKSLNSENNQ
jgi:hypothetical protein